MDAGRLFGRGISFPPRVGPDGRVAWSEGEVNVREAIRIILMTEPRERLRLPEFGGGPGPLSLRAQHRDHTAADSGSDHQGTGGMGTAHTGRVD